MKAFIVILSVLVAATAAEESCYSTVAAACTAPSNKLPQPLSECNAVYGGIKAVESKLQKYAQHHISSSYEYLLMSTHFANYEKSREGFEKLFRALSDSKWATTIDIIKYISKRGGEMRFSTETSPEVADGRYELPEIEALAKALDIEKSFAKEASAIHIESTRRKESEHDPEVSSYIEEEFSHKQADTIRKLSGYVTDLNKLLSNDDASLALHFFDDFLAKQ